jgi:phosphoglycerate dehydrogenase-like enzyme
MPFTMVLLPPETSLSRAIAAELRREMPDVRLRQPEDLASAAVALEDADAAFGTLTPDLLSHCAMLRWLQAPNANPPAGFFFPELAEHPVTVTNFSGTFSDHVATHAVTLMLALARGLDVYLPRQAQRLWEQEGPERGILHLPEATALVLGLGGIGRQIAHLCAAFDMTVLAIDPRVPSATPPGVSAVYPPGDLDDVLGRADVVLSVVPHTSESAGMIAAKQFALMKPTAYFINVGRGKTVVQADLVEALHSGQIAGAALDVFGTEPAPPDDPIWTAPNVILTPHVATRGLPVTDRFVAVALDNAQRFSAGRELVNIVDKRLWF